LILDRGRQVTTGCNVDQREGAERALGAYVIAKWEPAGKLTAEQVQVADAITAYLRDVAPDHARPKQTAERAQQLLRFFGDKRVSQVNGASCRAYARQRGSEAAARRELEDLRAALLHYHREGHLRDRIAVWLPPRPPARERWLTRGEVARLLGAARRRRLRHVAAFILCAIYTGQRAGRICDAALGPTTEHGYFDLDHALFVPRPGHRETKKRQPKIPIPRELLRFLRRWKRRGQRFAIERNGERVMRMDHGFRDVVVDAGLDGTVTPHILRHTCATWLMQAGTDMWTAAGFLGMSPMMIQRVYGHHHPQHLESAVDAFRSARRANGTPTNPVNET
jgi:integrase